MIISILQAFDTDSLPRWREAGYIFHHWKVMGIIGIPDHRRESFGIKGEIDYKNIKENHMNNIQIYHSDTEISLFSEPTDNDPCFVYDSVVYFSTDEKNENLLSAEVRVVICAGSVIETKIYSPNEKPLENSWEVLGVNLTEAQKSYIRGLASTDVLCDHTIDRQDTYDDDDEYCEYYDDMIPESIFESFGLTLVKDIV